MTSRLFEQLIILQHFKFMEAIKNIIIFDVIVVV